MTWWMIALLAYFIPMVITVALISEYGIRLYGDEFFVFVPLANIFVMFVVAGKALEEIGKAKRYKEW